MMETKSNGIVVDLFRQILDSISIFESVESQDLTSYQVDTSEVVFQILLNGSLYTISRADIILKDHPHSSLSPREKEIVRLVANGMANKNIAALLEISPWTVATHLRRIFIKLGVRSRAEMIARLATDKIHNDTII
jgi:two-component system, NarL family, nitrate/nitrite response regulator NarL